jgi:uncharacterized protein GlcG (DUF336 family)
MNWFRHAFRSILLYAIIAALPALVAAGDGTTLPTHAELTAVLDAVSAEGVNNGAIFSPAMMWAAVVDRTGQVVAVTKTTGSDPWPGSRVIAMQKANTASAFSNRNLALSTANLHTAVQPGGSLYGLQHSNPVDPAVAYRGPAVNYGTAHDPATEGNGRIGGVNVFGGGVPLYHQGTGEVLGALGVSGDSSCADHVIAWRMRHRLGFTKVPGGVNKGSYGGTTAPAKGDDNIIYEAGGFSHPFCGFEEKSVADLPSMQNF